MCSITFVFTEGDLIPSLNGLIQYFTQYFASYSKEDCKGESSCTWIAAMEAKVHVSFIFNGSGNVTSPIVKGSNEVLFHKNFPFVHLAGRELRYILCSLDIFGCHQ